MFENTDKKKVAEYEEQIERGIALRNLRESLGVSQEIFGTILGISEEEVKDLELNGTTADKMQEIQDIFGK